MSLKIEKDQTSVSLYLGAVLMAGDPAFREFEECLHVLGRQNYRLVTIDFSDCIYIDSHAITVIISLNRRLKVNNAQLRIKNTNAEISKLLHAIQLDRIIEIEKCR
jgi:anti-anti-sigma factor